MNYPFPVWIKKNGYSKVCLKLAPSTTYIYIYMLYKHHKHLNLNNCYQKGWHPPWDWITHQFSQLMRENSRNWSITAIIFRLTTFLFKEEIVVLLYIELNYSTVIYTFGFLDVLFWKLPHFSCPRSDNLITLQ